MFEDNVEIINEFVIEACEGMAEIESDLLAIEASAACVDIDRVNKVFRAIHSIKGAAGFLGLSRISELSHSLENILNLMRASELKPTQQRINVLLRAADQLKSLVDDVHNSESANIDICLQDLAKVATGDDAAAETNAPSSEQKPVAATPAPTASAGNAVIIPCRVEELPIAVDRQQLQEAWAADRSVFVMDFDMIKDHNLSLNVSELGERLADIGDILATQVSREALGELSDSAPAPASLPCLVVISTVLKPEPFARFWRLPANSLYILSDSAPAGQFRRRTTPDSPAKTSAPAAATPAVAAAVPAPAVVSTPVPAPVAAPIVPTPRYEVVAAAAPVAPVSAPVPQVPTPVAHAPAPVKPMVTPVEETKPQESKMVAKPSAAPAESSKNDNNIRVAVAVLDRLMNLAGELVLSRNQLLQVLEQHESRMLESVGARIDQVTSELQDTIMQTRMQPVGNVFNRFTRVVRDLSNTLGKQIQLNIEGQEVELDKTIIEAIGDPLTHLIRNSVDHGIEKPEVRTANRKPAQGTVHLRAFHEDGKVNISIEDDGAGIDARKLRRKAVEKGLLTQEKVDAMSDAEALKLIFLPGFSTAEQITSVSGRGVGMDVVRTNIEKLGGSIDIETDVGRGTTITVRLPLTLAIIPSLIVRSCGQRFAIPQINISELVRIRVGDEAKRIERLRDAEVLRLRGVLLPLVRLSSVVKPDDSTATGAAGESANILVVEGGGLKFGLIVDGLHDSEEIVVKPLGRHMKDIGFLAGATVLGDGGIALILDITGLAVHTELGVGEPAAKHTKNETEDRVSETISTLIFTNHPSEQFAIPMSSIARIERVRIEQIDSVGGQEVLQYRGGTLTLLSLEKCIAARQRDEQARVFVVVFHAGEREIGLILPEVCDILECSSNLDTRTFIEPGVLGSLVINGRATRFLDTYELARRAHPEWFGATPAVAAAPAAGPAWSGPVVAAPHQPAMLANAVHSPTPQAAPKVTPVVLLAEDSTFFRNKVKSFIEQIGAEVVTAEDGQIAWNILCSERHQFAGVVTDIEMPNMNGFELCEQIRGDARFRHLPVIALTSLASDEHVTRGTQIGINEYLIKLDRDKLVLAVTSILSCRADAPQRPALV